MKNFLIALVMGLTLMVSSTAFSQDSIPAPDTVAIDAVVDVPADNGTLVKIDEVVDALGTITGVDTLNSIDEAFTAVKDKIEEGKSLKGQAWYSWLSYALTLLALLFGIWKLFFSKKK